MPARLRPTAPLSPDAILVGDPGRALLLAQELLAQPKMSNHARGLWGYTGGTEAGAELTVQATGMGGPSAAMVLTDLAELGVRRAIRVGTCLAFGPGAKVGELLLVREALAVGGSAASFGVAAGDAVAPDAALSERLAAELGDAAKEVAVASVDSLPVAAVVAGDAAAADMQTLAVLARARELGLAAAAVLAVAEVENGKAPTAEELERAAVGAGRAAARAFEA